MNDENNKELEAHLQQLWIASISTLAPEFQTLCSKEPPEQFYAAHYYDSMQKLFGKKVEKVESKTELSPMKPQRGSTNVGMRAVMEKRPLSKVEELARSTVKKWPCRDLLVEGLGCGKQW